MLAQFARLVAKFRFSLARRFRLLRPLVDAEYGSAAFVAATRPVEYEVRVSTTGLLMRPVLR